jgi:hypothetical protein
LPGFTYKEKVQLVKKILQVCRKNQWNDLTPTIADKIEGMLTPLAFTKRTRRDYQYNIIELLKRERVTGKRVTFN